MENGDTQNGERITSWIGQQPVTAGMVGLTIVIPAYNEERRLPPTLIDIIDYCDKNISDYEILVVDDGSSDQTCEVVKKFERVRPQVRLIHLPKNYGKGHAVRLGVLNSHGSRVLFADADGATPISEIARLSAAIDAGADVSIGSRALGSIETKVETSIHRRLLGRVFNRCVNLILLPDITDTQCGFKMFTRSAALFLFRNQRSDRFSFDVEILFLARRVGLKITEVAINWTNIPGSKVNLVLDAIKMFRDIFRFRVIHRHVDASTLKQFEAGLPDSTT